MHGRLSPIFTKGFGIKPSWLQRKHCRSRGEISEWSLVFFSSAWLALSPVEVGTAGQARRVLDRVFKEAPARLYKTAVYAIPYAQIAQGSEVI